MPQIRNTIRRLRFERGEMPRQTIIALEAGRYSPSLLLAYRIAEALDASLEEVFQFDPG